MEAPGPDASLPPQRVRQLTQPPAPNFTILAAYNEQAKQLLVSHKGSGDTPQATEHKLRHRFSKLNLINSAKRSITKHDVAVVFNALLGQPSLPPPGLAQAVLNHAPGTSIDELWRAVDGSASVGSSGFFKVPWLDQVTNGENLDYIRLLCHAGVDQLARDNALTIALTRNALAAIELLLSYGANPAASKEEIRGQFKSDNVRLAKLLLAAPNAMTADDWQFCLRSRVTNAPLVFAWCLCNCPELASPKVLLESVAFANLYAVKTMLDNPNAIDTFRNVSVEACRRACLIENDSKRQVVLVMLARAGMIRDTTFMQSELARAVRLRQSTLMRGLINAGVTMDSTSTNVLGSAIVGMDFDILSSFAESDAAPTLAPALDHVPDSASEQDILRLFSIFQDHIGEPCDPLHRQLIRAVHSGHINLVRTLLNDGAAVNFQDAEAVKQTIQKGDLGLLDILLGAECSPNILSSAIVKAMKLEAGRNRLETMESLLKRSGAPTRTLGESLQQLVSAAGPPDMDLIRLLVQHNAPIDGFGDDSQNCIMTATRKGDLPLLKELCAANPQIMTVSQAVPFAFRLSVESNYKIALGIMAELLKRGAEGTHVHKTLLEAAKLDNQLNFVRALLKARGDANYENGAAYAVALHKDTSNLFRMLCSSCPPNQATLENNLPKVTDPHRYKAPALDMFLASASPTHAAAALKNFWSFAKLKENPNAASIIPCFLKYGLDVNVGNGYLLELAILKRNVDLLKITLSAGPSLTTTQSAFSSLAAFPINSTSLPMMELLLQQASSSEIGQSKLLPQQVIAAVSGSSDGLKMLLRYRAAVDLNNGEPVRIAAKSGSLEVLDMLLVSKPAWTSISAACQIVLSSPLDSKKREAVFQRLLDGAADKSVEKLSQLLSYSLAKHPKCTELPPLLLARDAEPDLETCQVAVEKMSFDRYLLLISNIKNKEVASNVFKHFIRAPLSPSTRHRIYECLLPKGIPSNETSAALLQYLKADRVDDLSVLKLLLHHGAAVGYENGLAFRRALFGVGSVSIFKLLMEYIKDDKIAYVAFETAKKAPISADRRVEIYRALLLKWNARGPVIQEALVSLLKNGRCDLALLQLLLQRGADPNKDQAQSFILACTANAEPEFRVLSSRARLDVVLQALMAHFRVEGQVVRWMNICIEGKPTSTKLDDSELLFRCLRTFPKDTGLLKLLLNKGVSASTTTLHSIYEGWLPEQCTPLIWALSSMPRIENDVIRILLDRAGNDARPAFSSPSKEISAAFLCLLDKSRTDVLKMLLRLDIDQVLSYQIPGPSFERLALHSTVATSSDFTGRLPLHLAALFLGNFDAFRLVSGHRLPNDGLLHNAAWLALPDFVEWCLKTDDPNGKEDDFEGRIPLAVACHAKYMPWCKFGNATDFKIRQKETMVKLAPRSDPKWRERQKTVLHIAFDNGPETTSAMLDALGVASDRDKHLKYRYTDQEGRQYSPREYVMDIMGCDIEQKHALVTCLSKAGFDALPGTWR